MAVDWQFMCTAPKNATWVEVMMDDGTVQEAHWACDESGEEQPPFKGWFISKTGCDYFSQIEKPMFWRDLPKKLQEIVET